MARFRKAALGDGHEMSAQLQILRTRAIPPRSESRWESCRTLSHRRHGPLRLPLCLTPALSRTPRRRRQRQLLDRRLRQGRRIVDEEAVGVEAADVQETRIRVVCVVNSGTGPASVIDGRLSGSSKASRAHVWHLPVSQLTT